MPGLSKLLATLTLLLVPAALSGQPTNERDGLILVVNGPAVVAAGEHVETLVVFNGDATVNGTARTVVVVNGTAHVAGTVTDQVVVAGGHLDAASSAVIEEEVLLYRSTIERAPGARILGVVHHEPGVSFSARASWSFWFSVTLIFVAGALLVAGLANRQLAEGVRTMVRERGTTALAALLVMVGLPTAAMIAFMTVVGIPLGFVILFMLLPAAAFLGYIVTGTVLGAAMIRRTGTATNGRLYAEAALGVFTLQLLAAIPVIGGLIAIIASVAGAGALAARTWHILRPHGRPAMASEMPLAEARA